MTGFYDKYDTGLKWVNQFVINHTFRVKITKLTEHALRNHLASLNFREARMVKGFPNFTKQCKTWVKIPNVIK